MKKLISLILTLIICASVTSCANENGTDTGNSITAVPVTTESNIESNISEAGRVLYVKDNSLFYIPEWTNKPILVAENIGNIKDNYIKLSSDGKTVFYITNYNTGGFPLYCRDVSVEGSEAIKLADGMSGYSVSDSGELVTFIENGALWQHDLTKKHKISDNVMQQYPFFASPDGKTVYYITYTVEEGCNLHVWKDGKSVKISDGAEWISGTSDDFKTVYFSYTLSTDSLNGTVFCKYSESKGVEIIADGISYYFVYSSGEAYYSIKNDYSDTEALWYYDKNSSTLIASDVASIWDNSNTDSGKPAILYRTGNDTAGNKYYLAYGSVASEIDSFGYKIGNMWFNDSITKLGFHATADDAVENGIDAPTCDFYVADIVNGIVQTPTLRESDVNYARLAGEDDVMSCKNADSSYSSCTIYINGNKIGSDIFGSKLDGDLLHSMLVYYTDYDSESYKGTLHISDFVGNSEIVAENVFRHAILPGGGVAYLKDRNESGECDLYIAGNSEKLDSGVTWLVYTPKDF